MKKITRSIDHPYKPLLFCSPYLFIALLITIAALGCRSSEKAERPRSDSSDNGAALPAFADVTSEAGLGSFKHQNGAFGKMWFPEQMGSGCGFIDYDGDEWLDILLVGGGAITENTVSDTPALWLYRNNGDGTFSLKTSEAGLDNIRAYGTGICAADYDNDGDEDFFFTTLRENRLFRNDGGRFTEVTEQAGLIEPVEWSSSAIFFDADKDGWLDLYVAHYADWSPEKDVWCSLDGKTKVYCAPGVYKGVPSSYYHSNGDGTFTDMTEAAGFLPANGKSLGVVECDFNKDGWPDLMVANDGEGDLLYENNGNGTFKENGMARGVAYGENGEARAGMGIDAGVVDDTGYETVFVGNFSSEMIGVYRYSGNGWFIDRAAVSKIGRRSLLTLTFGLFLMDFDFDGDLDLFVANGHVYPIRTKFQGGITYRQQPQLFLNNGDATFDEVGDTIGGVFKQKMVARGAAYGDFDRDGDPDVLLTENGGPAHLWRNDFRNPNFLRVKLAGKTSNHDGLGSRIVAVVENKKMIRQRIETIMIPHHGMERRIRTGSSYLSQLEKTATFGLGHATIVDTLAIYWPSEQIDRFTNVQANQEILVIEGEGAFSQQLLTDRTSFVKNGKF